MTLHRTKQMRIIILLGGLALLGVDILVPATLEVIGFNATLIAILVGTLWALAGASRPFLMIGQALLGAFIGGAGAFGLAVLWLKYVYVPHKPTNDMDFGGLADVIVIGLLLPIACSIPGFVVGLGISIWRQGRARKIELEKPLVDDLA